MQNQQPSEENEDLLAASINSSEQQPSQPSPSPSYYQTTAEWGKETVQLAKEGFGAVTALQIMFLWGTAAFAVQVTAANKYGDEINTTGIVVGSLGILSGTYLILRNEAYRLRLSDRTVKIEQTVMLHTEELRKVRLEMTMGNSME